jgi:hypothetical protein
MPQTAIYVRGLDDELVRRIKAAAVLADVPVSQWMGEAAEYMLTEAPSFQQVTTNEAPRETVTAT